jgi:hypothetical protein
VNDHAATAGGEPQQLRCVRCCIVRAGMEMDSPQVADLGEGAIVLVKEVALNSKGIQRFKFIQMDSGIGGWASRVGSDGTVILEDVSEPYEPSSADANPSSQPQKKPSGSGSGGGLFGSAAGVGGFFSSVGEFFSGGDKKPTTTAGLLAHKNGAKGSSELPMLRDGSLTKVESSGLHAAATLLGLYKGEVNSYNSPLQGILCQY